MTASNYERSIAFVLVHEGGYVNHAADPGGPTNLGITLATLRAYRGRHVDVADVKALTKAEAGLIYRKNYWDAVKGDQLPSGVDYAVFDYAVNSGVSRAAKFLQMCLHVDADGIIGTDTLKAAHQVRAADLINALCDRRLAFLKALPTWGTFGRGWASRVAGVRKDALAMAANPIPVPGHDAVLQDFEPDQYTSPRPPDDPGPLSPDAYQPAPSFGGFFDALIALVRRLFGKE